MTDEIKQEAAETENAENAETVEAAEAAEKEEETEEKISEEARELREALLAGDFDISEFLTEYKAAAAGKEEAEERATRVQADFDNFRRRSRRDAEEAGIRAQGDLIIQLLPITDNFERALSLMADGPDKEGVDLILKQLQAVLANAGATEIDALGKDFDPNLHHAVLQEESPENKGKVLMVLQKGYTMGDRLLRAAMVQVGV